ADLPGCGRERLRSPGELGGAADCLKAKPVEGGGQAMNAGARVVSSAALAALLIAIGWPRNSLADYYVCQPPPDEYPFAGVLTCACEGSLYCYASPQPPQLGAPRGAPTGFYQCCHTGLSCSTPGKIIHEDEPGCRGPAWPCLLGRPCENGPGACRGTCRSNDVTITEPGDGTLTISGEGTYCDAPMPGQNPETCNGIDDDCDGVIDNVDGGCGDNNPPDDQDCPSDQCCDDNSLSGSPIVNDPVHIGGGASYQRSRDVNIAGSIDNYALYRTYVS